MARKRLNKNLVVGLTLAVFAAIVGLSFVMLRQLQQRDPAYMIEVAKRYEREEAWTTAALFYEKAWERSGDPMHLVFRGDMLLNEGEVRLAHASWQQALVSSPDLVAAHMRVIELLRESARLYGRPDHWKRLRDAAEAFLQSGSERSDEQTAFALNAKGLALVALAARGEETGSDGEEALRAAAELAVGHVDYALDLIAHYVREGRIEVGESAFQALLADHGEPGAGSSEVHLAYANFLAGQRRVDEAEEYYRRSVTLAGEDTTAVNEARLGSADFRIGQWARAARQSVAEEAADRWYKEAEALLNACIESDPDDYDPYLRLAVLYKSSERHAEAVDVCESRLSRGLSRKGIEGGRNRSQAFSLMIYGSEACVALAVEAHQANDQAQKEEWLARASRFLEDARGEVSAHPRVLTQQARIKLARGLDRQALEDLRAASDAYRQLGGVNWENRRLLARLHLKLNEAGAAKAVLDEVLDQAQRARGDDVKFWTLYAEVLFYNNEYERAVSVADRVLFVEPNNAEALRIKARAFDRLNRPAEASRTVTDPVARAVLQARERALEGDDEGAAAILIAALEEFPADVRLVGIGVRMLLSLERFAEAREVTARALEVEPDDAKLQAYAVLVRDDLSAEERDRAMLEIIQSQDDPYQQAVDLIAFYVRKGDQAKALEYVESALEHLRTKDTPAARNAAADQHRVLLQAKLATAAVSGDEESMAAARDEAVQYNVDGAGGRSIRGLYHVHRKEFDQARRLFREAVEIQPTDTRSLVRLGQCLLIAGQPDEAAAAYERALNVNPNEGEAHWGLALLAKRRGDMETYERELAICEQLIPTNKRVRAELLARDETDDPASAIARREKLLATQPDDAENLRRLAVLCEADGDLGGADRYYTRLLELEPDSKDLVVNASRYYRRTNRPGESLAVLTRYAQSRDSEVKRANAQILIASHYLDQGNLGEAESTLLAAAKQAATFEVTYSLAEFYLQTNRPNDALGWVDQALEQVGGVDPYRFASALAFKVRCLLHRRVNDVETAQRVVDELLAGSPDYAEGLLLASEVHARTGRIDKAITALSDYLARRPSDPEALFRRANHYRASGRLQAAIDDLETLKRTRGLALDLEPRLLLARLHLQAGDKELWLRELESLVEDAPDSTVALESLVDAYIREQRFTDAERIVTAQINRGSEGADARWYFLRGRISIGLGEADKAIADYQRGASLRGHSAEAIVHVLDVYLRYGRFASGIDYYESKASTEEVTPAVLGRYARLLVAAGQAEEGAQQFRDAMQLAISESAGAFRRVALDVHAAYPTPDAIRGALEVFGVNGGTESESARANAYIAAQLHRSAGEHDQSAEVFTDLIGTSAEAGERSALLRELGDSYQLAAKPELARQAYEQALEHNRDNWVVLNNLAYLLSDQLGDYSLARRHAERAVMIADNPDTLDTLGWIYVGLGEYELAIAELSRAIRLDPSAALSLYHLGEAYRRNEEFAEATNVLSDGRELASLSGDADLVGRCDGALERARRSDTSP
ncbi:MAG: tetratricopeptide repeat protein [Phycisphaerae bacterium]|jgi:tetratricopeptide (TPR) repeat protein